MASQPKKVLIVDDDTLILKAYKAIIASEGYEVKTAEDGKEALAIVTAFKPDLILLDMLMPVMNGITFLQKFNPKQHVNTKVVVLSNSVSTEKLQNAQALGALEYMVKADTKPEHIKNLVNTFLAA